MAETDKAVLPDDTVQVNGDAKEIKMDFFQMTTVPPDWLNREYLEQAFREYEHDQSLHIFECEIVPATKPGDNFASVVFRANLKYTTKIKTEALSVIIKVRPYVEGFRKDLLGNMPLFYTEAEMYMKVLPEMQRLLAQMGDPEIIAPNIIYYKDDPEIIIFEDIAPQGYTMRHQGMNFENTKKVILKLAKFHALSFYMYHEEKKELDEYKHGLITSAGMAPMEFFVQGYLRAVQCIKTYQGYEDIADKMEKMAPHFLKKLRQVYVANKPNEGYNVLNHGDFHIKNLLFLNDENDDIQKVSFIDFQICVWGSPAIDLNYVMYCNASTETRDNHREELLSIYHSKFCAVLEDLGCLKKPPSLLELNIEMMKKGFIEILLAIQFMAMFFVNFAELADIDTSDMDAMTKKLYIDSGIRPVLEKLIVKFLHNGYLEI